MMNIWIRALITFIIIQLIIFSVFYFFTAVFPMPFLFVLMAYIPLAIVTALAIVLVASKVNRNTPRK
jgi:hypothetical protein